MDVFPPLTLPVDAPLYFPHEEDEPFHNTERYQTQPREGHSDPLNDGTEIVYPTSGERVQTEDIIINPIQSVPPVKDECSPEEKPCTPTRFQRAGHVGNTPSPIKESPGAYVARFMSFDFSFSPAKMTEEVAIDPPAPTQSNVSPSVVPVDPKSRHTTGQNSGIDRTLTRGLTGDFSQIPVKKLFAESQETQRGIIRCLLLLLSFFVTNPKKALKLASSTYGPMVVRIISLLNNMATSRLIYT